MSGDDFLHLFAIACAIGLAIWLARHFTAILLTMVIATGVAGLMLGAVLLAIFSGVVALFVWFGQAAYRLGRRAS